MRPIVVRFLAALLVVAVAPPAIYVLVWSDLCAPARCAFQSRGLLVNSSQCQIPDIDAFDACSARFVDHNVPPITCSSHAPLTYTVRREGRHLLRVADNVTSQYGVASDAQLDCCYSVIERLDETHNRLGPCVSFARVVTLGRHVEHVFVRCVHRETQGHVYAHVHAVVQPPVDRHTETSKPRKRRLNVLILGLDSMSRLSLQRNMPETVAYLLKTPGWFEMRGYTKVAKNTLPNVMAILTGLDEHQARAASCLCSGHIGYDHCPFLWNDFKAKGYVTSYAEDNYWSIFNVCSGAGFKDKPTDLYMRPMIVEAAKRLRRSDGKAQDGSGGVAPALCLGESRTTDVILKHAVDLLTTFREAVFGLTWLGNFSHEDADQPATEDSTMLAFFKTLNHSGALENTMLVFLSDHGIRYGGIYQSEAGWYEYRLPFFYIHVPPWFCHQRPEACKNLASNRDRLTSPFDLHTTLKDVLQMGQDKDRGNTEEIIGNGARQWHLGQMNAVKKSGISDHDNVDIGKFDHIQRLHDMDVTARKESLGSFDVEGRKGESKENNEKIKRKLENIGKTTSPGKSGRKGNNSMTESEHFGNSYRVTGSGKIGNKAVFKANGDKECINPTRTDGNKNGVASFTSVDKNYEVDNLGLGQLQGSAGCPRCVSLFDVVEVERECADAGVSDHLCACWQRSDESTTLEAVKLSAGAEVARLNTLLRSVDPAPNQPGHCALLHVGVITRARRVHIPHAAAKALDAGYHAYEVAFEALPGPHAIEVSVRHWIHDRPPRFEPVGLENRVNFAYDVGCKFISDFFIRVYCYCLPE